jgi:hypothetical protein
LPHTGYYAATNAFPRNTTVIVTNLENGKTIQVAVVAALDNSSVLILLSRDAADAIALSANYPGRVRIMEAIDPVTMLPLMENRISNGDPDYDPMARIDSARQNSPAPLPEGEPPVLAEEAAPAADAEGFGEGVAATDEPPPLLEGEPPALAEESASAADAEGFGEGTAAMDEPPPLLEGEPSALAEESAPAAEAEGFGEGVAATDEPPPLLEGEPSALAEEAAPADAEEFGEDAATDEPPPLLEGEPSALAEEAAPADAEEFGEGVAATDEPPPLSEGEPPALAEEAAPAADAEEFGEGVAATDEPPPLLEGEPPALAEKAAPAADAGAPVIYSDDYSLALVPAEERAPEGKGVEIPLDKQVAPIETYREQERTPDPASFITSIDDALAASQPQDVAVAPANFSAPIITNMAQGMYYVQLRSYSRPELVESELARIGKQRNLAVQVTELSGKQLYRILIGPVTYSESDQLLREYKAKGWNDAFIWLGK